MGIRIHRALKKLRALHDGPGGFLRWLASESGIDYNKIRRLSSGQQLASEADIAAISRAMDLEPGWEGDSMVRESVRPEADYSVRRRAASWLIEYLATGEFSDEQKKKLADDIRLLMGEEDQ